jgi:hypothetical protein
VELVVRGSLNGADAVPEEAPGPEAWRTIESVGNRFMGADDSTIEFTS